MIEFSILHKYPKTGKEVSINSLTLNSMCIFYTRGDKFELSSLRHPEENKKDTNRFPSVFRWIWLVWCSFHYTSCCCVCKVLKILKRLVLMDWEVFLLLLLSVLFFQSWFLLFWEFSIAWSLQFSKTIFVIHRKVIRTIVFNRETDRNVFKQNFEKKWFSMTFLVIIVIFRL